jgi:hypothetical protein
VSKESSADWDRVLSKLTTEDLSPKNNSGDKLMVLFSGLMSLSSLSGLSALLLMFANRVVVNAWPSIDWVSPAIGYSDAFWLSLIIWGFVLIKNGVTKGLKVER